MDIKEIVLATKNLRKLKELQRITANLGITVQSLAGFPDCPDVVEDGDTFRDNALKKAREICAYTGMPALADDSGLEVDALGGAPGVYSARYAGEHATDADNVAKVLSGLKESADASRAGRFHCVIALVTPSGTEQVFDGAVEGKIISKQRGNNGFGYDPVFVPEGHERTFAEMDATEKDSMSHRGRALEKFIAYIKQAT